MDLGLADRVYVVTGASRGLGFATAECLVADGARVVICSRGSDHVDAAAHRLGGAGHAVGIAADLADPATAGRLVEVAHQSFGRFDGALISVGAPLRGTAAQITDDQWRSAFETVFLGAVRAARTFAAALEPGGAIGFVLSSTARSAEHGLGISNGLRPGLAGVAKDMADEYASRGVRIISLLPHRIRTERLKEVFTATGDAAQAELDTAAAIPMGRLGEVAEFGRVAAFLLSPAAGYLTGISIPVDGGALRSA